jgi:hypothetical protein
VVAVVVKLLINPAAGQPKVDRHCALLGSLAYVGLLTQHLLATTVVAETPNKQCSQAV